MVLLNAGNALLDAILSVMYFIKYRDMRRKVDLGLGVTWAVSSVAWLIALALRLSGQA